MPIVQSPNPSRNHSLQCVSGCVNPSVTLENNPHSYEHLQRQSAIYQLLRLVGDFEPLTPFPIVYFQFCARTQIFTKYCI